MNERIAQLAEQAAQESALLENDMNLEVSVDDKSYSIPATFVAKFAELIVRECVSIVDGFEITQEVADGEYVDYEAGSVLEDHFDLAAE